MQLWTNIATLVTAVAALLVILEMRWQRHSAYKPDLLIADCPLIIYRLAEEYKVRTTAQPPNEPSDRYADAIIHCVNVGVGQAKNVRYEWGFDVTGFVEAIGQMDSNLASTVWIDGPWLNFEAPAKSMHSLSNRLRGKIAVIAAGDAVGGTIFFPSAYLRLYSVYADTISRLTPVDSVLMFPDPAPLTLCLQYEDIGDNGHDKKFTFVPQIISMSPSASPNSPTEPTVFLRGLFEVREG